MAPLQFAVVAIVVTGYCCLLLKGPASTASADAGGIIPEQQLTDIQFYKVRFAIGKYCM